MLPERPRILVVDDNTLDRQAVIRALRHELVGLDSAQAEVLEAETVAQAREALQREEFACVFLDHDLPDGTALDLLLEVRSQGLVTPIVVLTGERDEQIMAEVMQAGAADFLPKEKLHPDLIAVSLRAALRFLQVQRKEQVILSDLYARDRAIAAASNGIVIADPRLPDCPLIYANQAFLNMTGYTEAEVIGHNCRFLQGPDTDPSAVQELRDAVSQQHACQTLILNYRKDGTTFWNEITVSPVLDTQGKLTHFVGIQTDTSARQVAEIERRQAEEEARRRVERERFLAALAERARGLTDPDEVIADAVRSVGEFLSVSRCIFADIDIEADTCTVHASEYRADPAAASIVGVVSIASFGTFVVSEYAARRAVAVDDVRLDTVRAPEGSLAAYEAINIRAHVTVPVVHHDRVVSCMSLHSAAPRHWEPEEIELLRDVVERTWLTVEVIRQNRALVREGEATARILGSITDAFFALDGQFRFTYVNPQAERVLFRQREALLGQEIWAEFPEGAGSTFDQQYRRALAEGVPVSFEEFFPPLTTWFEVRAYPSPDGGLSVFFQNINERKALDAERERLAERERNIAAHLQDALQPALPDHVPGLLVGNFTQPALQEAQIGGDFYDIFPLDKELYAIVIGDVSGKGLAAAQQLALIRNSLRTTLYLHRSPAQAATSLNAILTAHDLLVGFVTAFVGVYDAATGRIAYASCGHEPGLIRRVSGIVERMETTGPPLGIDQNADYGELTITLAAGDSLLLYTDGISEAGPNRRELLGMEGLMQMLAKMPSGTSVAAQAEALVAEVSRYAGGVFRDDVAVLLAQRQ